MTYREAIEYLNSFINYEHIPRYSYSRLFKLERMREFLNSLGNPHSGLKVIHIAGSKGKGSICAMLAYILKEAGFKVGLYTSPHLIDFRERIRVLAKGKGQRAKGKESFEGMIEKGELCDLINRIRPYVERFKAHQALGRLSFFEVYTALAFSYFKEKAVDFAVIETGLGGRLDATNVIEPLVCGISQISLEHTDKLGNTLKQITIEKAGIIKEGIDVVTSPQKAEVLKVLKAVCKARNSKLFIVGRDFEIKDIVVNLIGTHQIINASTAIGIIERLKKLNIDIDETAIKRGLRNVVWPGRLQLIAKSPFIVLDGAQNPSSISALSQAIKSNFKYKRLFLIFGISSDKDIKGVVNRLRDLKASVILTKARDNPRAVEPDVLQRFFNRNGLIKTQNVDEALKIARHLADKQDLILVTGSLFVVGDTLRYSRDLK